ncbi:hypothetical protein FA95DRAFT_909923 [Auriscalpium vulgare]|uniref:Uncharacterized protein n=1 Tax=Auriscalpium vulgare TaxID=40419 RepID=A0ACB8R7S0_9AGAM|nr:hypothetical protein FA95DRAFT_909923 [Auriscalpium vulgare]
MSHAPSFKCAVYHKIEDAFTAWALIRFPLLAHTTFGVMWDEPPDVIRFTQTMIRTLCLCTHGLNITGLHRASCSQVSTGASPPISAAAAVVVVRKHLQRQGLLCFVAVLGAGILR